MKLITLLFLLFFCIHTNAKTYYFSSSSGDDSRTSTQAQSPSTPWKSINKLNSFFSSLQPGDSVLFKRGDTFYGAITINRSGTSSAPIVISAYGSGAKPVITGFTKISSWVSVGNGIYESSNTIAERPNMVLFNESVQEMGRYPNADATDGGFKRFETFTGKTSFTDKELSGTPNWTGAEVMVRVHKDVYDKSTVSSHSGSTIYYNLYFTPADKLNGYFIQNHIKTLDQVGEWFYNASTRKLNIYFGSSSPGTHSVQVSTVGNVIYGSGANFITLDNLAIQGAIENNIHFVSSSNINITRCDIKYAGVDGIYASTCSVIKVQNNTITDCHNIAIEMGIPGVAWNISDNLIKNISLFPGMAKTGYNTSYGIYSRGDKITIQNNIIESIGHNPIRFMGNDLLVKNNLIKDFNIMKDDGGGICTGRGSTTAFKRQIIGNIVLNGGGASAVTGTGRTFTSSSGIYLDDHTTGVEVRDNTISNCSKTGIYVHNSYGNTIRNNTSYDNGKQIEFRHDNIAVDYPIRKMNIKNNIFFSKEATQDISAIYTIKDDINLMGSIDSNYYCRPVDESLINTTSYLNSSGARVNGIFDLRGWQTTFIHDDFSKKTAKQIPSYKVNSLIGSNKFANGKFDKDINGLYTTPSSSSGSWVSSKLDGGTLQATVPGDNGLYQVIIAIGSVSATKNYVIRFSAQSTKDTVINVYLRHSSSPYSRISELKSIKVGPTRKEYEFLYQKPVGITNASIGFDTKGKDFRFWLDNIELYEVDVTLIDPEKQIRFEYNATKSSKTIELDAKYIDVKNNSYSGSVTLNPYTSIILMRDTSAPTVSTPNEAPLVSLISPLANTTLTSPASIIVSASAADNDGTISKVEFFNGNTLIGTATSSPFTITWSDVAAGTYSITAKATDNNGLSTTSSAVTIKVEAKTNTAPTVSITSPAANSIFTAPASITINASASDADGTISKVEFYNGNNLIATENTSPYSISWNDVAAGTYSLTAIATDNNGLSTTSSAVIIKVEAKTNTAPSVSITSPADNTSFTATADITINASASDADGTIAKVEFFAGNNLIGTITSSPYSYKWSDVAAGTYLLTAKATDNNGLSTTSSIITFKVEAKTNTAPIVSITSPAANTNFIAPASIIINASASDADGTISKVEFYNGTTLIATEKISPYSISWNNVAEGTYSLTAIATDDNGLSTTSSTVIIKVEAETNIAPTVSITSPVTNSNFTGPASITINASASDADGMISKVEFLVGNNLIGTSTSSPYSYTWSNVAAGTYSLTTRATDNNGLSTTSSAVTIIIEEKTNTAPTISITNPAANTNFTAPASITINTSASDADGTISKVEFFAGNYLIGTSTSSPYSFTWSNVAAGAYSLTAKATDNNSLSTTSSVVTIKVEVKTNTAPIISITSPAANTNFTVPASITINASAFDADGTISKVEFFAGNNLVGTSTSNPYSFTWSNVAAGTYSLTTKATDNDGLSTTSSAVSVKVEINTNIAPVVSILSPKANTSYTAPANITINAGSYDPDGTINKVEFYADSKLIGTTITTPYTITWSNVPAGVYSLMTKATDNKGLTTTSSAISVKVNGTTNTAPIVSITSPAANTNFSAPATLIINASASDADGTISKVEFFAGNNLIGTTTSSPYNFTWSNVDAGTYSLTAKATDNHGLSTTSSAVSVSVESKINTAPSVSLTSPVANTNFTAPDNISISASASDADGTISKVEFFAGNNLIGISTTAPFTFTWSNVTAGTYSLTAKATDNEGLSTTSSVVSVNVETKTNTAPTVRIINPRVNNRFSTPAEIAIKANASDADGTISKVEFFAGNNLIGTSTTTPYSFTWSNVAAGTYSLTAIATDDKGLSTTSSAVSIVIDTPIVINPSSDSRIKRNKFDLNSSLQPQDINITMYPNPVISELFVEIEGLPKETPLAISITSMAGVEVQRLSTNNTNVIRLDVSSLFDGIYMIKVISENNILVSRFIKRSE